MCCEDSNILYVLKARRNFPEGMYGIKNTMEEPGKYRIAYAPIPFFCALH